MLVPDLSSNTWICYIRIDLLMVRSVVWWVALAVLGGVCICVCVCVYRLLNLLISFISLYQAYS